MSTDNTVSAQRRALRRELKAARAALTPAIVAAAAQALAQRVAALPAFAAATRIAGYLPMPGEMDPRPALESALRQGRTAWVPVVRGKRLIFAPWTPDGEVARNHLGIAEPVVDEARVLAPGDLDLVLVPLLAFDPACNRLGMGGGFYDRTFAHRLRGTARPLLIGVAHESQKRVSLERADWDVPLDAVLTDCNTYRPPGRSDTPA